VKETRELQQEHSWFLYNNNNNTSANLVLSIQKFLKKNRTSVVPQPPTTLTSLSGTYFLFQKFKISLKGCQFESVQNTQEKMP
jgi:hypothetical protein